MVGVFWFVTNCALVSVAQIDGKTMSSKSRPANSQLCVERIRVFGNTSFVMLLSFRFVSRFQFHLKIVCVAFDQIVFKLIIQSCKMWKERLHEIGILKLCKFEIYKSFFWSCISYFNFSLRKAFSDQWPGFIAADLVKGCDAQKFGPFGQWFPTQILL